MHKKISVSNIIIIVVKEDSIKDYNIIRVSFLDIM